MNSSDYDHIFKQKLYVRREFEKGLVISIDGWLRRHPRRLRWISLKSKEGRGNTTLLERLRRRPLPRPDGDAKGEVQIIFVAGASGEQDVLNPLARALHEQRRAMQSKLRGKLRSHLRRLKLQIKNNSRGKLTLAVLSVLTGLALGVLLTGLGKYAETDGGHLRTFSSWRAFFTDYLPHNFHQFPLWFLIASLIGLVVSLPLTHLLRSLFPPPPGPEKPNPDEIKELSNYEGLTAALLDCCRERRGVFLLIDDAHELKPLEKEVLRGLFTPKVHEQLAREDPPLLIVTLSKGDTNYKETLPEERPFSELEVDPFDELQLRRIADMQLTVGDVHSEEDKGNLVELAKEDVKVLFARRNQEQMEKLGQSFQKLDVFANEFNGATLMAYQLVRREPFVEKKWLSNWLPSVQNFVELFGMSLPITGGALVKQLLDSELVETQGETIIFNPARCEALRQWLKREKGQLLAQAHYYWLCDHGGSVSRAMTPDFDARALSVGDRKVVRDGAWHAVQICALRRAPGVVEEAAGLSDQQRWERRREAVALLLAAAALSRAEGDLQRANTLAASAELWLRDSRHPQRDEWLERIADQFWRDHLMLGDLGTRQHLGALADTCRGLTDKPFWRVYQRFEAFAQGKAALPPPPDEGELLDPALKNLHRLTETLLSIRQSYGFMSPALGDPAIEIREPIEAPGIDSAEFSLYQLRAAALNERGETAELAEVLRKWRARLQAIRRPDGLLGDRVVHTYNIARYWHLLADVCWLGEKPVEAAKKEEREVGQSALVALLTEAWLISPAAGTSLPEHVQREAQEAYEEARRMVILLGYPTLLMEASFHLGFLLQRSEPNKMRWDDYFKEAIEIEAGRGWTIHAPDVHMIRWAYIQTQDREWSIKDAINTYEAAKRAGYPLSVVFSWHRLVRRLLTNYSGDVEEKLRWCVDFYVEWAQELAALPEAAPHREYKELRLEQTDSLIFAAQALRILKEFERSGKLLGEAESLIESAAADAAVAAKEEPALRDLRISVRLQRAWLLRDREVREYNEQLRDIWRELRPADGLSANVLGSLLGIEENERTLNDSWPPDGQPAHLDPLNDGFSLPAAWFQGDEPLRLKNRYDFRLRQFLRMAANERQPTQIHFSLASKKNWWGKNKFPEVALSFAQFGLGCDRSDEVNALIEVLLEVVRDYYNKIEGYDRRELDALWLLMMYSGDERKYQAAYVEVLSEFERLREREKSLSQKMAQTSNWIDVVEWADRYLGLLVDKDLQVQREVRAMISSGPPLEEFEPNRLIEEFNRRRLGRIEALQDARLKYRRGEPAACAQVLNQVLPESDTQFVFTEDVRVLDLWLRCVRECHSSEFEKVVEREAQFQKFVMLYIEQLSELIKEQEVQRLAKMTLSKLQEAAEKMRGASQPAPARQQGIYQASSAPSSPTAEE